MRAGAALRVLDRPPAELDLESVAAGLVGERDQVLARLLGDVPWLLGQLEAGCADLAVGGEARPAGPADAAQPRGLGKEAVNPLRCRRAVGTAVGAPDDINRAAREPAEALSDQGARGLRVRAGRRVVGVKLALEGVAHGKDHDQDRDPSKDHQFPASVGDVGETGEACSHGFILLRTWYSAFRFLDKTLGRGGTHRQTGGHARCRTKSCLLQTCWTNRRALA